MSTFKTSFFSFTKLLCIASTKCNPLVTSATEVMFYRGFVCLCVCLSVSRITRQVVDEFDELFDGSVTSKNWSGFGGDLSHVWFTVISAALSEVCALSAILSRCTVIWATNQLTERRLHMGRQSKTGASTPYKRWSKCTMEKVWGSFFA